MSNDVRRPKDHDEMLTAISQSDKKVFSSYKDALVFAACLAYSRGEKRQFDKSSDPVGMHIFRGEFDLSVFQCVSLADTGRPQVMADEMEDERISRFEEYACAGLDILKREVFESPEDWDIALERLMVDAIGSNKKTILEDITDLA